MYLTSKLPGEESRDVSIAVPATPLFVLDMNNSAQWYLNRPAVEHSNKAAAKHNKEIVPGSNT